MIDVPVTHFKPRDIGTSVERLIELGYTHDIDGQPLSKENQILELYPQDFIPSQKAEDYLLRTSAFVDELLERFYEMEPFYNAETAKDLVGHLCVGLAPHTSGGVLTRIIGWSKASAGYGHTLYHAAKRRNCDGDEDALILLLDCLLNFSRVLLPSNRGGRMDAPLTLSTRLNPEELDKEALNVDTSWWYHRGFYEATQEQPNPTEIANQMDIVDRRKGSIGALRGYGFTHDAHSMDSGPENSSYKTLETMIDKMNAQLLLGQQLRAVDVRNVASQVVESHFLPDLRGNLLAFTRQKFRCVRCGRSFRRFPLSGKCIETPDHSRGGEGMRSGIDFARGEAHLCGGNLALTVSEGAVRKYIRVMQHVIEHYEVDLYTKQRVDGLVSSTDSLFKNDRVTVFTLDDFISG
jgi:DNA polymerase II large subunit